MQPFPFITADMKKDPEICTVHHAKDALLGKAFLAALEKASINIYLVYLFPLGLCVWREICDERMLSVSLYWISIAEVTKC